MNHLVKIITDDCGDDYPNKYWHLVFTTDGPRTVCTGEVFGYGEGAATYKEKSTDRGITCPKCIEVVKWYKSIKL